jgi:hypothetical protein
MRWSQRLPDSAPNLMFFGSVRSFGNWLASLVTERQKRNLISSCAIFLIAESRMVRIKNDNGLLIQANSTFSSRQMKVSVVCHRQLIGLYRHMRSLPRDNKKTATPLKEWPVKNSCVVC